MKLTLKKLEKWNACEGGVTWFKAQKETDAVKVIEKLVAGDKWKWANWTICRVFNRKQKIQYVVYAAEQVIGIYEAKHPDDKRPREAIEAAKAVLKHNTKANRAAASEAAWAASEAEWAARAAEWAARAAAEKEMKIKILNYGIGLIK